MDMTGGLAPAVQAFSAQLPGLIDKLTALGATDEATALQAVHDNLTAALANLESNVIQPLLARFDAANTQFARAVDVLATYAQGFEIIPRSIPPKTVV